MGCCNSAEAAAVSEENSEEVKAEDAAEDVKKSVWAEHEDILKGWNDQIAAFNKKVFKGAEEDLGLAESKEDEERPRVIPAWVNDGVAKNHDWDTLVLAVAMSYEMCLEIEDKVKQHWDELQKAGWQMVEEKKDYVVLKHPDDDSAIMAVAGTRVGGYKPFASMRDLGDDMLITFQLENVLPRTKEIEEALNKHWDNGVIARDKTVIVGHSLGGTVTLATAQKFKLKAIALNPGGLGAWNAVHFKDMAMVHIKNDPISMELRPDCYRKEVDMGFTLAQGLLIEAHRSSNFFKVTYDQIKAD